MRVFRLIAHYLANTGRFDFHGFLHSPRFSPQPSFGLPFSRPSSLPHSFPFCTRVARISSGTIVAVKCFSPWKDIVLLSACLYNLGNAIFPRTDISTPPLSSHVHTKGAPVDGGRVVDPSVRSCSWSFPELYRKIRRERENSRGHRRLLRNVGGSEKDPTRWRGSRGRPSTDFFAGKEEPSISPSKMTIRRGWLGKRLFIATHIQTSSLYTLVDIP